MKKTLIALIAVVFLSGCVSIQSTPINTARTSDLPVHRSFFLDKDFFDRAYTDAQATSTRRWIYGGIIPHHLLASHVIADFFRKLEKNNQPEVVVVIGPNHREVGEGNMISSRGSWITPYGELLPNTKVINGLTTKGIVTIDERVFTEEHSISSEVAFIKKSFPRATFVPIVLKTRVTTVEAQQLAQLLKSYLPKKSLVIASVDFAHYVDSDTADQQDAVSLPILESLDTAKIDNVTVDSKPTILTLMHYLRLRHATRATLINNSNTAKVVGDSTIPEVTSYITMYFSH